jgi:hypothetical protein
MTSGYPDGYTDTEWTTEADFAERVIPARAEALNERLGGVLPDGMRFDWASLSDPPPAETGPEPLLVTKYSAAFLVPQVLLDDYAGMSDVLGKVFRGEIDLKPPPPPKRHRCLACWLVSLLPGHDRCSHGYAESGCERCGEW